MNKLNQEIMSPITKWLSFIAVGIAMLVLLYFTGVINSGVSLGMAIGVIAGVILLSMFLVPPPKDKK